MGRESPSDFGNHHSRSGTKTSLNFKSTFLHQVGQGIRAGGARAGPRQRPQSIQQHIWVHFLLSAAGVRWVALLPLTHIFPFPPSLALFLQFSWQLRALEVGINGLSVGWHSVVTSDFLHRNHYCLALGSIWNLGKLYARQVATHCMIIPDAGWFFFFLRGILTHIQRYCGTRNWN